MRVLGIDYGFKRIGVAVGETELAIATPRQPLTASGTLAKDAVAIAELYRKEEAELLVLGVPLMEDAPDGGKMARICLRVQGLLQGLQIPVALVDESLTSVAADAVLREVGLRAAQRKAHVDGEAAAQILERFMAQQAIGDPTKEAEHR